MKAHSTNKICPHTRCSKYIRVTILYIMLIWLSSCGPITSVPGVTTNEKIPNTTAWKWSAKKQNRIMYLPSPVIATEEMVLVTTETTVNRPSSYFVTALDITTGEKIWERVLTPHPYVVAKDGTVVVRTSEYVACYSARDGSIIWQKPVPMRAAYVAITDNTICLVASNKVVALSAIDGSQLWDSPIMSTFTERVEAPPSAGGGRLFIPCGQPEGRMVCLQIKDGKIVWEKTFKEPISASPVFSNGYVFVRNLGSIFCLNAKSGKIVWRTDVGASPGERFSVTVFENAIYVPVYESQAGMLYKLNASSGTVEWKVKVLEPMSGLLRQPVLASSLYVVVGGVKTSQENKASARLSFFDTHMGEMLSSYDVFPEDLPGAIVLWDKYVVVQGMDRIVVLKPNK